MKNGRFQIGDRVVGNSSADRRYSVTRSGWRGAVINIKPDYDIDSNEDTIEVKSGNNTFWVNHKYFDLIEKSVVIKGVSLPDCCGTCFAYSRDGCAFIKLDTPDDIWKKRSKKCPIAEE